MPLENVPANSVTQATTTLQNFLRTLAYDFSVKYIKSSGNQLTDCMSRLGPLDHKIKLPTVQVHEIKSRLQATASRIQLLHETTAQDNDFFLTQTCCTS